MNAKRTKTAAETQKTAESVEKTPLTDEASESKIKTLFRQLVSYGLIGLLASGVDTVFFSIFVYGLVLDPLVSNIVSTSIGITISFFLNRKFTFKVEDHMAIRYAIFFGVGMCGLVLSEAIIYFGTAWGVEAILVKLASVFIVAVFQFTLNKLISFRSVEDPKHK